MNTVLPQNPPKLFTRNPVVCFPEVDKTCVVYKSLACSQDLSKICWRVEICSVVLRPRQKPHWVSSSLGSIIFPSWHALFLGSLAKRCRGRWFHSIMSPFLCMGTINLLIFRHPSKTPCHSTHTSQPNHPAFQVP